MKIHLLNHHQQPQSSSWSSSRRNYSLSSSSIMTIPVYYTIVILLLSRQPLLIHSFITSSSSSFSTFTATIRIRTNHISSRKLHEQRHCFQQRQQYHNSLLYSSSPSSLDDRFQTLLDENKLNEAQTLLLSSPTSDISTYAKLLTRIISQRTSKTTSTTDSRRGPDKALSLLRAMSSSSSSSLPSPNTVMYNIVIDAHAEMGRGDDALSIVKEMKRDYDLGANPYCEPDVVSYNGVLKAYAVEGRGRQAEELLDVMMEESGGAVVPDIISYSTVLSAYASYKKPAGSRAALKAEALLDKMERQSSSATKETTKMVRPTTFCVNAVLTAWSRSRDKGSADRAEAILNRMEESGRSEMLPNSISYNIVITAHARSSHPISAQKAESTLLRMEKLSHQHPLRVQPTTASFNSVLNAWAQATTFQNNYRYNKGPSNNKAPRRAEAILRHMDKLYAEGSTNVRPDAMSYGSVMNAWARVGEAERAEEVLKRMRVVYERGNKEARPNTLSYNTVINAWSKSGKDNAASKAHDILKFMEREYTQSQQNNEDAVVKPDVVSYTSVIDAYAKNGTITAASTAMTLLTHVETLYNTTKDPTLRPSLQTYTSVVNAYSRSKQPHAAQALLERVTTLSHHDDTLRPDVVFYNAVINSWGWSFEKDKVTYAKALFDRMASSSSSSESLAPSPDIVSVNSLLNACAYADSQKQLTPEEREHIVSIATEVFDNVVMSKQWGLQPNGNTYGMIFMVVVNLLVLPQQREDNDNERRIEGTVMIILETLFQRCCDDGMVTSMVVKQLQSVLTRQKFYELMGMEIPTSSAGDYYSGGRFDLNRLPADWRRNVDRRRKMNGREGGGGKKKGGYNHDRQEN